MNVFPTDYQYLYGKPSCSAAIRCSNEDFLVNEISSFTPDGEGEHWYLKIQKEGENTDWIAKQLAIFFNVGSKEVGYAGKKDRHAITQQWFSVCLPGVKTIDVTGFDTQTIKILDVKKHSRKLRTGALKGNQFKLRLKNVSDGEALVERLSLITQGVPNYFGEQRFGIGGGNLSRGVALLKKEFKERNRVKKGLYISAVRSWIFNHLLSNRIEQNMWSSLQEGDVVMLEGTKSHFVVDDIEAIGVRMASLDLHLTGPLCGRGRPIVTDQAMAWENEQLANYESLIEQLAQMGLSQERRALRLIPQNLHLECESKDTWLLSFELPAGAFATSVLRELCLLTAARNPESVTEKSESAVDTQEKDEQSQ